MTIKKHIRDLHLNQLLRLKKELEAVEAVKSYNFNRVKFLEKQKHLNYKNEYDRLEGELSRGNITGYAKRNIEKRKEFLKKIYDDFQN